MKGNQGLYCPMLEHDNCGIGAVVNIKGKKTHQVVSQALEIVENLEHRAGKDAEGKTGDGVGILLQISHRFFKKVCLKEQILIGEDREYGIGMFFFPADELTRNQSRKMFETIVAKEGLRFLGWRKVPVHEDVLGKKARDCMPYIMQGFIEKPSDTAKGLEFDRRLYAIRREFEQSSTETYIVSLSGRTIVYNNYVHFLRIFRIRIIRPQSPWYTQDLVQTQSQAGTGRIRTVSSFTTGRSIRSREMRIRCSQEKREWFLRIFQGVLTRYSQWWIRAVQILPCWIILWNFL